MQMRDAKAPSHHERAKSHRHKRDARDYYLGVEQTKRDFRLHKSDFKSPESG